MPAVVDENLTLHREIAAMTENAMNLKRFRQPGDGKYWSKALQRALDAAANEETGVKIPNGTHLLDAACDVLADAPVRFVIGDGRSSLLKQVTLGYPLIRVTETPGIRFMAVSFEGVATVDDDSSSQDQGIMIRSLQGTPAIGDNVDVEILGCYFKNLRYSPSRIQYCRGVKFLGCYVENCSFGPQFWDVKRVRCCHNELNGSSLDDALSAGIGVNTTENSPSAHNEDVIVANNIVHDFHQGQSILVHDGLGVQIKGNTISEALIGISAFPSGGGGHLMEDILIEGNIIRCTTTANNADETGNYGINAGGRSGALLKRCRIAGNSIYKANHCKDAAGAGAIALQDFQEGTEVVHNLIDDPKGIGIVIAGGCEAIDVSHNIIRDLTLSTEGYKSCIQIRPEAVVTGICRDNIFDNATDGVRSRGDASGFVQEDNERYSITNPWAIEGSGTLWQPIIDISANRTLTRLDRLVFVQTNVAAITVTLPATPWHDMRFLIKDKQGNAAVNNITIARNGKNIDGAAADIVLNIAWSFIELACDGSNWFIIGAYPSRATP